MSALALLEPSEITVRRRWLIGIVILAVLLLYNFFMELTPSALVSLVSIYVLYHCTYKHPGTTFLTLNIFFTIPTFFALLVACFKTGEKLFSGVETAENLVVFGVSFMIVCALGWWIKLSLEVRRINKKIRKKKVHTSQAYLEVPFIFAQADSLDALNKSFNNAVDSKDSDFVKAVRVLYKARKNELERRIKSQ